MSKKKDMLDEDDAREAIRARYNQQEGIADEGETVNEPEAEAVADEAEKKSEPEEAGEAEKKPEAAEYKAEEDKVAEVEKPSESDGDSRLKAIEEELRHMKGQAKEEREKRKSLQTELAEARERERQLLELISNGKAAESTDEDDDEGAIVPKTRRELEAIRKETAELKRFREDYERERQQLAIRAAQEDLDKRVSMVDSELEKQGYPGFSVMKEIVGRTIYDMHLETGAPLEELDTPVKWKEVYVKSIYPLIAGKLAEANKSRIMEGKTAAKSAANLATPGKSDSAPPKPDSDEWTFEDYMKARMSAY